nr:DUF3231 family protein [Neobacillus sp. Marseille-Q6967]
MTQEKQIRLTSAEIAHLWEQYMNDTASICINTYFLEKVEDTEIKTIIEYSLQLSQAHINKIKSFLTEEKYPLPHGFKIEEDVDLTAPRLFSDSYILNFIHQMSRIGLNGYSLSLSLSVRSDITNFYKECLSEYMTLYTNSKDLLLSKGLYIRPPYFSNYDHIDFVDKQSFLWDFGEKRPLTAIEITELYDNLQRNALGVATLIGFSQVARTKEVTKFFVRGIGIAKRHVENFGKKLKKSALPIPMTWDSDVTTSTHFTFSEKIMMFYTTSLIALSIGFYGTSSSVSLRIDLSVLYAKLTVDIQRYAEDGANIMIKNRWLEQPPMAPDRDWLARANYE